jgi:1-deoxy-D-xylulose-5-phosphate synthase
MAFEGLNHAGVTDANLLVILNDNAIGIDPSVGALKNYLTKAKIGYKPRENNIIEALNFTYKGPIDGHDLPALIEALETLKQQKGPCFLHVITTKGKGLAKAEQDQVTYHAPGKFDKNTGEILKKTEENTPPKYQDVYGLTLVELAENNPKIIGITPAMPTGSSLKYMMQRFPERAFDVGIAEQHAVTFAAGLATQGYVVFCAIYSTFLQRAMDQVIHDVALQNLPVIFCIDRAGLVGNDGATHHGVFDIALLKCIPNMMIATPSDEIDLRNLLYTVSKGVQQPIAIRYPRGLGSNPHWQQKFEDVAIGKYQLLKEGNQLAIISVGHMRANVEEALLKLGNKEADVAHYAIQFIKPFQADFFVSLFRQYSCLITIEDGCIKGGFGEEVSAFAQQHTFQGKIIHLGIPDEFIEQGSTEELYELVGLAASQIAAVIQDCLK